MVVHGLQAFRTGNVDDLTLDAQESRAQKIVVGFQLSVDVLQFHLLYIWQLPIREIRRADEAILEKVKRKLEKE